VVTIWPMLKLQIESVESPIVESLPLALLLVARAQLMDLLPPAIHTVDRELLADLAEQLQKRGIATIAAASLHRAAGAEPLDDSALAEALRATIDAVASSPHPEGEWNAARELLDDDLLGRLVGVSSSSLRRYAKGERKTPDDVAWRLHLVVRVLAALLGSYNGYGVRRWFLRPRSALGGSTPADVLARGEPEEDVRRVVELAEGLLGPLAAA
jgi:Protein of unknown function (DUF2384)